MAVLKGTDHSAPTGEPSREVVDQRYHELRIIHNLNTAVLQSQEITSIYQAALDAVLAALKTDRASILLFDPDGVLRFKAWRGLTDTYRATVEGHTPWTQDTKDPPPIVVSNVIQEPSLHEYTNTFLKENIHALGFFPLIHQGCLLGKFMAYFREVHTLTGEELLLGQTIANHIGLAVARARNEQELRESEERYRFAMAAAGIGTWDRNLETGINRWSDIMGPLHGLPYGTQPASYQFFVNLIHPEDRPRVTEALAHAISRRQNYDAEFRVVWPDGAVRWKSEKGKVFTDSSGKPVRMSGIGMDVTEKKAMEEQLREREAHYHFTLLSTDTCTWERNLVTGEILWSDETYPLFGFDPSLEPSHEAWEARLHPEDIEREREVYETILRERQESFDDEFRIVHPQRGVRWLLSRGRITYAEDGTPLRMVGVNTDITDRKVLENERERLLATERQARQEAELAGQRLKFLAEASLLLVSSLDYEATLRQLAQLCVPDMADWCAVDLMRDDGVLERVSVVHADPTKAEWAREYRRRFPPSPKSTVGAYGVVRTGRAAYYPQVPDTALQEIARDEEHLEVLRQLGFSSVVIAPLATRERVVGAITLVYAESGRTYSPEDLLFAEELARRAAVAVENAGLYEELEVRVQDRTRQLQQVNAELEAFSYSVSHDLRAPLRGMAGFSQALLEDYGDRLGEEGTGYLQRIKASSERMGALIDGLLILSRLSQVEFHRSTVNLSDMAQDLLEDLQHSEPERIVTTRVQDDLITEGDGRLLRQVMQNLLENAWKFTRKQGQAVIEVGRRDDAFFVRDNGAGFSMKYAGQLFGAFQRLHTATEFEGTGIGLALVKRIINRHGGSIWAEAEEGRGATFLFTLPQDTDEAEL